jgi:hypothetical protein
LELAKAFSEGDVSRWRSSAARSGVDAELLFDAEMGVFLKQQRLAVLQRVMEMAS